MMTFEELLREKRDAIVRRWFDDVLSSYSPNAVAAFSREKDPFANPVGHSLRVGTRGIFDALLDGRDAGKIAQHLEEMIKVRAVQQFTASEAVGFVFRLKGAVRAELAGALKGSRLVSDLAEFDEQIDQVALAAFDTYVKCREQLCDLRVNEVKRSVSWVMKKLNQRGLDAELSRGNPG